MTSSDNSSHSLKAITECIHRNIRDMRKVLPPYIDNNSSLLDIINHTEALVQQIEYMTTDDVIVSKKEYNRLLKCDEFLLCLQSAGVDNWDGYDIAQGLMNE